MKQQLEHRLKKPKSEFESGQKMLAELEARQANLRDSLLRISGAIQVLEEEPAGQGCIFCTQRQVKDINKIILITYHNISGKVIERFF